MISESIAKAKALAFEGEDEGGAEIVQVIIVLAFAIGLGIGLFFLQGVINQQLCDTGGEMNKYFNNMTKNKIQ